MKISIFVVFALTALFCCNEARPQVPDQVAEFLKQTFFNPIQEKVDAGGEEASHVISQLTNITQAHAENDKHDEHKSEDISPIAQILSKIQDQEDENLTTDPSFSTGPTDSPTENNNDMEQQTTPIPEEKPIKSKTPKVKVNYLAPDEIAKLKTMCPSELGNATDIEVVRYRYFEPKSACFRYGFQGPCGEGMKLYIKEFGSLYGTCDCRSDVRMWVYHEETFACYKIFSQGGCSEGNYLDVTEEGLPICSENPCASNGTDYFKLRGVCAKIGKPNTEVCEGNKVVDFIPKRRTPDCILTQPIATNVGFLPCRPGSVLAVHGKCQISDWDFGKESN